MRMPQTDGSIRSGSPCEKTPVLRDAVVTQYRRFIRPLETKPSSIDEFGWNRQDQQGAGNEYDRGYVHRDGRALRQVA